MAKLFEEVISTNAASSSADIIIHFSCVAEASKNPPEGSTSPVPTCASRPGDAAVQAAGCFAPTPRCGIERNVFREVSPRSPRIRGNSCSGSPNRILSPLRPAPATAEVSQVPPFLRCHSLVLQTQPTLLEKLLPNAGKFPRGPCNDETMQEAVAETIDTALAGSPLNAEAVAQSQEAELTVNTGAGAEHSIVEVTVDDEPEIFLEMIKFVYLNTCLVEQSNVKALMLVADKYNIEDIVRHCLQWMEDNFCIHVFYMFITFRLPTERFRRLILQSLLRSLRSRRHFTLVTEDTQGRWDELPIPFMEALLGSNDLPVISEAEVLKFLARWASGVLSRQESDNAETGAVGGNFAGQAASPRPLQLQAPVEDIDGRSMEGGVDGSNDSGGECSNSSSTAMGDGSATASTAPAAPIPTMAEIRRDQMLRLLRTFRKTDISVRISEIDPILQLLQLNSLFSTKPPRETAALDPGFMIYRGVAGVNVPAPFGGGLTQPDVVPHAWKGGAVVLNGHDFLQQTDGFKPSSVPGGDLVTFPRLWTKIKCPSWFHLQKRSVGSSKGHVRHSVSGPVGSDFSSCDSVSQSLMSMPLHEAPHKSMQSSQDMGQTLKTMQSQDDWEIGRKHTRQPNVGLNISENEKIEHKVIAAVISGHIRHGIRICQRERSSIYDIEELNGQSDEVCIGGSPTEVEFELQLTAQAPDHCGICRCVLAVLPAGESEKNSQDTLMEINFSASAEEPLHFKIESTHFDYNSSYSVELGWVLRPQVSG